MVSAILVSLGQFILSALKTAGIELLQNIGPTVIDGVTDYAKKQYDDINVAYKARIANLRSR